jgi:hypothetical protein
VYACSTTLPFWYAFWALSTLHRPVLSWARFSMVWRVYFLLDVYVASMGYPGICICDLLFVDPDLGPWSLGFVSSWRFCSYAQRVERVGVEVEGCSRVVCCGVVCSYRLTTRSVALALSLALFL